MKRMTIYDMIDDERERQKHLLSSKDTGWGKGDCSSRTMKPEVKVMVLSEECGEVARAVLDHDKDGLKKELIQVAAVCVAWLESLK